MKSKKDMLIKLMYQQKSRTYYATHLKLPVSEIDELLLEIENNKPDVQVDLVKGTRKISSLWDEAPTASQIEKKHGQGDGWMLSQFWVKPSGTQFKVSANFKKSNADKTKASEDFSNFLGSYKSKHKPLRPKDVFVNNFTDKCGAILDLTDFHLDKKGLFGETVETRVDMFQSILQNLVSRAHSSHNLDEIVFVIGSDMLHTDTFFKTTTAGTPQDTLVDGVEAYSIAFDLYAKAIRDLKQFCRIVKVVLVMGNHGRQSESFLAHSLSKYFENDPAIVFDVTPRTRKVHVFGETFTGLHHGNCKIDDLPLIFAKEFRVQWGQCRYHQVIVGDKHFYYEKEIKGVRIKQLPALSDTDRWHDDNNYVENIRAGIISVYDHEKGKVAEFEERYNPKNK